MRREGSLGAEGRRPADVYVPRWRRGTPAALDFAVTSGLRGHSLAASVRDASTAVVAYEGLKADHLDTKAHCLSEGIAFIPMVMEACGGGWGVEAMKVWTELAKTKALASGELASKVTTQSLQILSVALHRENARAVIRRMPLSAEVAFE